MSEMIGGCLDLNHELLDDLILLEIPARTAPPKGYFWKVVHDPTRNDVEPGLFFGSYFRLLDIYPDQDEPSTWPDGIIFEHIHTGQQLTFSQGLPKFLNFPNGGITLRTRLVVREKAASLPPPRRGRKPKSNEERRG